MTDSEMTDSEMTDSKDAASLEQPAIWRRIVAAGIDFLLVPAVSFVVMLVSGVMENAEAYAGYQPWIRAIALGVAGYLLVNGWLLHRRGQTVGKWLTRIKIVMHADGSVPPLWRLIGIRALFFPLMYLPVFYSMFGLFALLPVVDIAHGLRADRRCLHDMAAGTRVAAR